MSTDATALLQGYTRESLQVMIRFRDSGFKGNKQQLVKALAKTLFDPKLIKKAVETLTPAERALLDLVVLSGGSVSTVSARAQLVTRGIAKKTTAGRFGYSRPSTGSASTRGSDVFEDLVARLGALCLLFSTPPATGSQMISLGTPGPRLYIPEEILEHLPGVGIEPVLVEEPADVHPADPATILRDSYLLLSFAQETPIPLTKRGQIMKRPLVAIDQTLRVSENASDVRSEDELGRLPFLHALDEKVGLLVQHVGGLYPGDRVGEFLSLPSAARQRRFFDAYAGTTAWCEVARIPKLTFLSKGAGLNVRQAPQEVVDARQRVLAELRDLPAESWISFDHLLDRMSRRAYDFLFDREWSQRHYYYGYRYGYGDGVSPYEGGNEIGWSFPDVDGDVDGWNKVEGGMIRVIVEEALHWLGVTDLGYQDGRLTAFRITPAGASILRGETPEGEEFAPNVVIQPNFQIFVFEPVSEALLYTLDQFAERRRIDQAIEYELTRDSVGKGVQGGLDVAGILSTLESISRVDLPQNVRRTVQEWGASHERVTIRRGSAMVQTIDSATLDALYADDDTRALLGQRLGPTVALISAANLPLLHDHLLASGRIPATSEGNDGDATGQLYVDPEGHIDFVQPLPSIFGQSVIRPFTEERPDGTRALTRDALRHGAQLGLEADQMIDRLASISVNELSPDVVAFIRRWAKNWGEGVLGDVTLLQVESADVMQDLLADPELRPDLTPLPGSGTHAIVRKASVARVRERLEARGMDLSSKFR